MFDKENLKNKVRHSLLQPHLGKIAEDPEDQEENDNTSELSESEIIRKELKSFISRTGKFSRGMKELMDD